MSETGRILGYLGLGVAGALIGSALTLLGIALGRHLAWRVGRARRADFLIGGPLRRVDE